MLTFCVSVGGVSKPNCPYQCISEKYRMPHCYTMLEDLIYTLGGPYLFVLFLSCVMVILALMLSVARMKLVGNDDFSRPMRYEDNSRPSLCQKSCLDIFTS
jgi:hypothetical protein